MGFLSTLDTALVLGLCLAGVPLALAMSLRFMNFPDLTVEGSFPFGAALAGIVAIHTSSLPLALMAGILGGALAGSITGLIHVYLGVGKLLSGILVLAGLYSISLRTMDGSNLSLLDVSTFWNRLEAKDQALSSGLGSPLDPYKLLLLLLLVGLVFLLGRTFLVTRTGVFLRATGDNEEIVAAAGRDSRPIKIAGLALANAMSGLSGALVALNQGFADVGMGQGVLVAGLASLIIGEQIVARLPGGRRIVPAILASAILGSVLYQCVLLATYRLGVRASDVKLLTAGLVLATIVATRGGSAYFPRRTF